MMGTLFGCQRSAGSELVAYVGGKILSLDPIKAASKAEQSYIANLYSGLYYYGEGEDGTRSLECGDADGLPSVRALDNGLFELTFTLKENLKWSNGEPITPEDYVFSWNRAAKYFVGSDKSYIFSVIDGYDSFVNYEDEAELNMSFDNNNRTFTVVTTEAGERFLSFTTETALFPVSRIALRDSSYWDSDPDEFASNGRYTLSSLKSDELVLKKNENYRDAKNTKASRITFVFDMDSAEKKHRSGKLTFALFTEDTSLMQEEYSTLPVASSYIAFNAYDSALGIFTEDERAKIRKAIAIYIIDSEIFSDAGSAAPVLSPSLNATSIFSSLTSDDADRLLSEVALSSGRFTYQDGKVYEFPILTALNAGRGTEQKKWAAIADMLSGKGISLQIVNCSWEEFLSTREEGNYSMLLNTWFFNTESTGEILSLFTSNSAYNDTMAGSDPYDASHDAFDLAADPLISEVTNTSVKHREALGILEEKGLVFAFANPNNSYYLSDPSAARFGYDGIVRFN